MSLPQTVGDVTNRAYVNHDSNTMKLNRVQTSVSAALDLEPDFDENVLDGTKAGT